MTKSPLSRVKESFGDKSKLLSQLQELTKAELFLPRLKDEQSLERLSNSKLLRLHSTLTKLKTEFGSRDALVDAILKLESRTRDSGYKSRLEKYPTPRLLDLHRSRSKRTAQRNARTAAKT